MGGWVWECLSLANMVELGARGQTGARKHQVHEVKAKWGAGESQEQDSRNQQQGCLKTETAASAKKPPMCFLPKQNAAPGTVCPGLQVGAG